MTPLGTISNQDCNLTCTSTITFTLSRSASAGTYTIVATGEPGGRSTSFPLEIDNSPDLIVSCTPNTTTSAKVGEPVTWTAIVSGGSNSGYTHSWSGSNIPTLPPPSNNPYTITYTTVGTKVARDTVVDSLGNSATCPDASTKINFNPTFEEF